MIAREKVLLKRKQGGGGSILSLGTSSARLKWEFENVHEEKWNEEST